MMQEVHEDSESVVAQALSETTIAERLQDAAQTPVTQAAGNYIMNYVFTFQPRNPRINCVLLL